MGEWHVAQGVAGDSRSGEWQETPGVGSGRRRQEWGVELTVPIESIHQSRTFLLRQHHRTWLELG